MGNNHRIIKKTARRLWFDGAYYYVDRNYKVLSVPDTEYQRKIITELRVLVDESKSVL